MHRLRIIPPIFTPSNNNYNDIAPIIMKELYKKKTVHSLLDKYDYDGTLRDDIIKYYVTNQMIDIKYMDKLIKLLGPDRNLQKSDMDVLNENLDANTKEILNKILLERGISPLF